jgi:hypothetical protein
LHEKAGTPEAPWLRGFRYVQPEPGAWMPPGGWLLLVDAPEEYAAAVNAMLGEQGIYAAEVRRREASLEQFFLALTAGQPAPSGQFGPPSGQFGPPPALSAPSASIRPIAPQE